jgi:hypothetical protein
MRFVAELLAQLPDALHERLIGHGHVRPHGVEEFLLRYQAPSVECEVGEHPEGLGRQVDLLAARARAAALQIEDEAVKSNKFLNGLVHLPSHP